MAQAPFFSEQDVKQNTLNVLKWTKGTGTQQQVNSLQAYINIWVIALKLKRADTKDLCLSSSRQRREEEKTENISLHHEPKQDHVLIKLFDSFVGAPCSSVLYQVCCALNTKIFLYKQPA